MINPIASAPVFHHSFFPIAKVFVAEIKKNTLVLRNSPLMSQPEGMCRIAAKGISLPVSMRKPAQSIRLP